MRPYIVEYHYMSYDGTTGVVRHGRPDLNSANSLARDLYAFSDTTRIVLYSQCNGVLTKLKVWTAQLTRKGADGDFGMPFVEYSGAGNGNTAQLTYTQQVLI